MTYDVIIVGGGTSGCVMAARLSENPDVSVLLLEAGPDYKTVEELPDDIKNAAYMAESHDWGYRSQPDARGTVVNIPRGKVIGGSSSRNYCFAVRPRPSDHDAWVAAGAEGWGFDEMLPLYKKMERAAFGEDRWHGRDGVYEITRADAHLAEAAAATVRASAEVGIPWVDDLNAPGEPGIGLAPLSAVDGVRESTAIAYLNPVRDRPNLEVRGDTLVDRVLFDGTRATGVRLVDGTELHAGTVVLSGGYVNTPTLLMRSGIGPAEHLREVGIDVLVDAPGVGQNLIEHPVMFNLFAMNEPSSEALAMYQTMLSAVSEEGDVDFDLQICPTAAVPSEYLPSAFVEAVDDHPTGYDMIMFTACIQPQSRGSIRLASADPNEAPLIDLGLYSDRRDAEKVAEAVRLGRRLTQTSPLKELVHSERAPGAHIVGDDLVDAVLAAPSHYNHGSGTAKMGRASDPTAVVDPSGRVYHVDGLVVADASVFPTIPRVPTNPAAILVAEKISQDLGRQLAS